MGIEPVGHARCAFAADTEGHLPIAAAIGSKPYINMMVGILAAGDGKTVNSVRTVDEAVPSCKGKVHIVVTIGHS